MIDSVTTHWLPIDSAAFDTDETVVQKGVQFHVFLSPYDLPEAVRGRFEPAKHRLVIEFRYLGDEQGVSVVVNKDVTLHVGAKSRRLQGIELDIVGLGANQFVLRIDRAIDALPSLLHSTHHLPHANFEVARNVLHRKQPELLATLR